MKSRAPKMSRLVCMAIKKLNNNQGVTPRDILNYIVSGYDKSQPLVKRQILASLRRGIKFGYLKRIRGHYRLNNEISKVRSPNEYEQRDSYAMFNQKKGYGRKSCMPMKRKRKGHSACGPMKQRKRRHSSCSSMKSRKRRKLSCGPTGGKRHSRGHKRRSRRKAKMRKSRSSRHKYNCGDEKPRKRRRRMKKRKQLKGMCCASLTPVQNNSCMSLSKNESSEIDPVNVDDLLKDLEINTATRRIIESCPDNEQ